MSAVLLCPEAVAPDVEELLAQAVYEVKQIAQHEDGYLVAISSHLSLTLLFRFFVGDLFDQVLVVRHVDLGVIDKTLLERRYVIIRTDAPHKLGSTSTGGF